MFVINKHQENLSQGVIQSALSMNVWVWNENKHKNIN